MVIAIAYIINFPSTVNRHTKQQREIGCTVYIHSHPTEKLL